MKVTRYVATLKRLTNIYNKNSLTELGSLKDCNLFFLIKFAVLNILVTLMHVKKVVCTFMIFLL